MEEDVKACAGTRIEVNIIEIFIKSLKNNKTEW